MLYEYAVEPEATGTDFKNFRTIASLFGIDRGRYITQLPGDWVQRVLKAAEDAGLGEVKLKSIEDRLHNAGTSVVLNSGRRWDKNTLGWLDNALAQHNQKPFAAILADCDETDGCLLNIAEFLDTEPVMQVPTNWEVPRTLEGISDALLPMTELAGRIHIIDPYFGFTEAGDDFRGPLQALLEKLDQLARKNVEVNIHYRNADGRIPHQLLERQKQRRIGNIIPEGFNLILHEWSERPNGADFHDRYLITNIGGLMLGAGFGATNANEMLNITRVGLDFADEIEQRFDSHTGQYDLAAPVLRVDSRLNFTPQSIVAALFEPNG